MPSIPQSAVAEAIFAIGILAVSAALWTAVLRSWHSRRSLIPKPPRVVPWGIVDLGIALGIWLFGFVIAGLLTGMLTEIKSGTRLESIEPAAQIPLLWISGSTMLVVCLMIAVAMFIRHRVTPADMGWDPRSFGHDVLLGFKAFVMLAPIVYGIQLVLTQIVESKHPLIEMLKENPNGGFFAVAAFAAVIVAPISEEFLFRVLLQGWLERLFRGTESSESLFFGGPHVETPFAELADSGSQITIAPDQAPQSEAANPYLTPAKAEATEALPIASANHPGHVAPILISSAFFALSHWSHGPDPIPLFVFALGLGYLYQSTHRIVPCIVLHFLLNACSLGAMWMMVK